MLMVPIKVLLAAVVAIGVALYRAEAASQHHTTCQHHSSPHSRGQYCAPWEN